MKHMKGVAASAVGPSGVVVMTRRRGNWTRMVCGTTILSYQSRLAEGQLGTRRSLKHNCIGRASGTRSEASTWPSSSLALD